MSGSDPSMFSILAKELSIIACDMYGKTKHTKDPTDRFQSPIVSICFVGFDKAIIRFPLLLDCYMPGTSIYSYA